MIQSVMLVLLGVFAAALLVLLVAPAYWRRAVRITTEKMKRTMPMTTAEIRAEKDRIRAESAIRVHRLQKKAEQLKLNEARQLIELNRRDARINEFDQTVRKLKADLTENQNARRVMEQTINYRLPQIEARLLESKRLLTARDREMMHFVKSAQKHDELLSDAKAFHEQQRAEIERLRGALTLQQSRDRGRVRDPGFGSEIALKSEIEALRSRNRDQTTVIERLQLEVMRFTSAAADKKSANSTIGAKGKDAASVPGKAKGEALDAVALAARNKILAQEVEDLKLKMANGGNMGTPGKAGADSGAVSGDAVDPMLLQAEIKKLRLKTEAQSAEIQDLTSELKEIYAASKDGGRPVVRLTKRVLNSKISALEKRTERQAETVARLRAELASVNERAARQAAYYMKEMRQFGVGPLSQPYEVRPQDDRRSRGAREAAVRAPVKGTGSGNGIGRSAGSYDRAGTSSVKLVEKLETKAPAPSTAEVTKVAANARGDRGARAVSGGENKKVEKAAMTAKTGVFGRKRLIDRISGAKKS